MRITACTDIVSTANPMGYFQLDDGRVVHEVSLALLAAFGYLENSADIEMLKGEFYREQAYSLQGAEAISALSEGNVYKMIEGAGIVAGKEFDMEEFEIPQGVKFIGKGGFQGIKSLQSVSIPSSVEVIEEDAFNGCINLKQVQFTAGLKTIQSRAFANTAIEVGTLYIPDSVESISMKTAFPKSTKYVYVGYNMSASCRRALSRCGLTVRYRRYR